MLLEHAPSNDLAPVDLRFCWYAPGASEIIARTLQIPQTMVGLHDASVLTRRLPPRISRNTAETKEGA